MLALALGLALCPDTAAPTPSFAAAARLLSPGAQRSLLGDLPAPALLVRPGALPSWTALDGPSIDRDTSPPRVLSLGAVLLPGLDRSTPSLGVPSVRERFGLTGRGVVVAIVDSGLDVSHRDFRDALGATRVAWLLDLTAPPRGVHPSLEARFSVGSGPSRRGAVWSASDLDAALASGGPFPGDETGHGTHVASIASGNGLATGQGLPPGRYVGVAPEATLVIVKASSPGARGYTEAAVVAGVAFSFDRAEALGRPAVVNLSLGTHQGAHDGASTLERALAAFVPEGRPGRALVVSAGNDGERALHARLALSSGASEELPWSVPTGEGEDDVTGVELAYEGRLTVAVRGPDGVETPPVPRGRAQGFSGSQGRVSVANATEGPDPETGTRSATVLLGGEGRAGGTWRLVLRGEGLVDAWCAPEGRPRDERDRPRFTARAVYGGTITLPATSPSLVSVGALSTRAEWPGPLGSRGAMEGVFPGDLARFSGRGPNRRGALRPDLVAPGEVVLAALSSQARDNPESALSNTELLADDGVHVAGRGSSAAAPQVTGAMALLLEHRPTLSQRALVAALAGGARSVGARPRWDEAGGWGSLDVAAAMEALGGNTEPPDALRSELSSAAGALAVGESAEVSVRLADSLGRAVTGSHRVRFAVTAGSVSEARDLGGGRHVARYSTHGVEAPATVTLEATVDGVQLAPLTLSVRRDPWDDRVWSARGGCDVGRESARGGWTWWWVALSALARGAARRSRWPRGDHRGRGPRRRGPR